MKKQLKLDLSTPHINAHELREYRDFVTGLMGENDALRKDLALMKKRLRAAMAVELSEGEEGK